MAALNWAAAPVRLEVTPAGASPGPTRLTLRLGAVLAAELRAALEKVYGGTESELRHSLPDGWTLFWKARESDDRALLAHPSVDQWVGTLALTPALGAAWVRSLDSLSSGQEVVLSHLGRLAPVSNLDLVVHLD